MRRVAQDDSFSLMPSKNCQRMTEHLQSRRVPDLIGDLIGDPGFCPHVKKGERFWIPDQVGDDSRGQPHPEARMA